MTTTCSTTGTFNELNISQMAYQLRLEYVNNVSLDDNNQIMTSLCNIPTQMLQQSQKIVN